MSSKALSQIGGGEIEIEKFLVQTIMGSQFANLICSFNLKVLLSEVCLKLGLRCSQVRSKEDFL